MSPPTEAIILAGGLGTRLRSVVGETPKSLAVVSGRPFLDWLLDDLRERGIQHVVLATGYCSESIEGRYRSGYPGLAITLSRENEPLGTGGAIRLGCSCTQSTHVLAVNGDTFAAWTGDCLTSVAARTRAPITVGLKRMGLTRRYGTATLSGDLITGFCEKRDFEGGLINAGVYLLEPAAVPWPSVQRFSFEHDVLEPASSVGAVAGAILDGPFIDIGIPEAYEEAQKAIPEWSGTAPPA